MSEEAKQLFNENILATLATINEDGSPWSTPLHVIADDSAVYWFSKEAATHSKNIVREPRVSISLFSPDESQGPKGIYVNGVAEQLDDGGRATAYALFEQRLGSVPAVFETARAYRLPIGVLDPSKSSKNCWYFYT